jgi:AbrB family looped-hinge helix DNA binding protein
MASHDLPHITRISSKGQVVIPAQVRDRLHIKPGGVFAIIARPRSGVLVLKKIDSKSLQIDLELFRDVERAWKEIERGKSRRTSKKRFVEELRTW